MKVCRANCDESRPPLDESRGESLMSPLVMCGPQDLHFNVPVELRYFLIFFHPLLRAFFQVPS